MQQQDGEFLISVRTNGITLEGMLGVPQKAQGTVLFAHGSGSSRFSPRNNFVAGVLRRHKLATLLIDLLTPIEDQTYETRFDIDLLTQRLASVARWIKDESSVRDLPLGLFGASTGAASALRLAAWLGGKEVYAVVSRGGRPDLAQEFLSKVAAPTLLIVGGDDDVVLDLNRQAYKALRTEKELAIIPGATHLFEETGALEMVADKATKWFTKHLPSA